MSQAVSIPDPRPGVLFLDESDPKSFLNRVPESFRLALKAIPSDYLDFTEGDWVLKFKNRTNNQHITDEDWVVRANFWHEYNRSMCTKQNIHLSGIYAGAMTYGTFEKRFLKQPDRLAFMICPMLDQAALVREGLNRGLRNLLKGLETSPVREDGTLDAKAFSAQLQAVIWLDAWQNGGITQKIEQKTLNVNASVQELKDGGSGFIDKKSRIAELEAKLRLSKELGKESEIQVIDVTSDTSDKPSGN